VGVVYKRDGLWWEWFIRGLAFGGSGLIRPYQVLYQYKSLTAKNKTLD
jgi:hypothetical protein